MTEQDADAMVGLGGGKVIDAAKAVAMPRGLRLVIAPTIASSTASSSATRTSCSSTRRSWPAPPSGSWSPVWAMHSRPGSSVGALAAAHAIRNGLTALEPTHDFMHGEKVTFGVASMLMLEQRSMAQVDEVFDVCLWVGLPLRLADIGLADVTRDDLRKVAEAACAPGETIHNDPFDVHPGMVVDAMLAADASAQQRRESHRGPMPEPAA